MKKPILSILCLLPAAIFGQQPCLLDKLTEKAQSDPVYVQKMQERENDLQQLMRSGANTPQAVVTIPVVVHILYNTAAENITDQQVQSQLTVLNQDFMRLNPDTANTPSAFLGVTGNPNVQFCLAQRDPAGNATTGITRTSTTHTSFNIIFGDTSLWHTSLGGKDPWDVNQYLNIWVADLGPFIGGIGFWPGGTSLVPGSRDGVVINYIVFGTMGTATPPYDGGRSATHEIGHYLDLHHLWGDSGPCSTDFCTDTPDQNGATQGCPAFPLTDNCTGSSPGIQFMNFMDYSNDNCKSMFSANQCTRISACLNGPRSSLLTSMGCVPVSAGMNETDQLSLIIGPNPGSGIFQLQCGTMMTGLEVTDFCGKRIFVLSDIQSSQKLTADLSSHPPGVYFFLVSTAEGMITKKVVLQ